MAKLGWMGSTGITEAGDPQEAVSDVIGDLLKRGYQLRVRWRPHERRFHAYVDLGDVHSSQNFMAESLDEALAGLEHYLKSCTHHDDEAKA